MAVAAIGISKITKISYFHVIVAHVHYIAYLEFFAILPHKEREHLRTRLRDNLKRLTPLLKYCRYVKHENLMRRHVPVRAEREIEK